MTTKTPAIRSPNTAIRTSASHYKKASLRIAATKPSTATVMISARSVTTAKVEGDISIRVVPLSPKRGNSDTT